MIENHHSRLSVISLSALTLSVGSFGVLPGCEKEPGSHGENVATSEPNPHAKFFADPKVQSLVGVLKINTQASDTELADLESRVRTKGVQEADPDIRSRLDAAQSDLLFELKDTPEGQLSVQLVSDISKSLGTEIRLVNKIESLIRFGPADASRDKALVGALGHVSELGKEQSTRMLLMIALYHPDERVAGNAAELAAKQHEGVKDFVLKDRAEILELRLGLDLSGKEDEEARRAIFTSLSKNKDAMSHLENEVLPKLNAKLAEAEEKIAHLELVRKAEAAFEEHWQEEIEGMRNSCARSSSPSGRGHSNIWGYKEGERHTDLVPVGAQIYGIKYRSGDRIDGIQLLYRKGNRNDETPWRGGQGGAEHFISLDPDEYIGRFGSIVACGNMERIEILTSRRTIVLGASSNQERAPVVEKSNSPSDEIDISGMAKGIGIVTYSNGEVRAIGLEIEISAVVGPEFLESYKQRKDFHKKIFVDHFINVEMNAKKDANAK